MVNCVYFVPIEEGMRLPAYTISPSLRVIIPNVPYDVSLKQFHNTIYVCCKYE